MKKKAVQLMAIFLLGAGTILAQDIQVSEVPSVIANNFKKEFPKANDIEWEIKGEVYNVEFEIGRSMDYEAWYNASGKLVRYTQEISDKDLPKAITRAIKKQFKGYRVDDAKKIVENEVETYKVEIEKGKEEHDLMFSKNGKLIKNE